MTCPIGDGGEIIDPFGNLGFYDTCKKEPASRETQGTQKDRHRGILPAPCVQGAAQEVHASVPSWYVAWYDRCQPG